MKLFFIIYLVLFRYAKLEKIEINEYSVIRHKFSPRDFILQEVSIINVNDPNKILSFPTIKFCVKNDVICLSVVSDKLKEILSGERETVIKLEYSGVKRGEVMSYEFYLSRKGDGFNFKLQTNTMPVFKYLIGQTVINCWLEPVDTILTSLDEIDFEFIRNEISLRGFYSYDSLYDYFRCFFSTYMKRFADIEDAFKTFTSFHIPLVTGRIYSSVESLSTFEYKSILKHAQDFYSISVYLRDTKDKVYYYSCEDEHTLDVSKYLLFSIPILPSFNSITFMDKDMMSYDSHGSFFCFNKFLAVKSDFLISKKIYFIKIEVNRKIYTLEVSKCFKKEKSDEEEEDSLLMDQYLIKDKL